MKSKNKRGWRQIKSYRIWRINVIRRDKLCQICGTRKNRQAHHLNSGSYFLEDRYEIDNGICLCKNCHIEFHTNYKRSFKEKCTKYDWENFSALFSYLKTTIKNKG